MIIERLRQVAKKLKKTTKKKAAPGKSSAGKKAVKKKAVKKKAVKKKVTKKKTIRKKTAKKKAVKKKTTEKKKTRKKAVKKKVTRKKATRKKATKIEASAEEQTATRKAGRLSAVDIEYFKKMLLRKRAQLIGDVNSIESEALRKSRLEASGDLSSMPIHMADIGTDNFEQEFALGLMSSERKILAEINAALQRIDWGRYGICEGTNGNISKARLRANPWARYCIKYAKMVEQGLVVEGEKVYSDDDPYGLIKLEEELEVLSGRYAFTDDRL